MPTLFARATLVALLLVGCAPVDQSTGDAQLPQEIIDLGALVTEDLPQSLWGKRLLSEMGFDSNNKFEVIRWEYADGAVRGSNSRYTLFNHGGPHVDAPSHVGLGEGIDSYSFKAFSGPLKVIDVSRLQPGYSVSEDAFRGHDLEPGDIVAIYTAYRPPVTDDEYPVSVTLTREAAEYLARIPIRAFVTDGWGDPPGNPPPKSLSSESAIVQAIPIHHSFLSRGIPIYEHVFNLDRLVKKEHMYFVGPPLNVENGDGMMVRPAVLVY